MIALTVGAALSQTGMYALQGQQALQGLCLWVEETNAHGGLFIPERRQVVSLQLIAYDDHSRRADVERLTAQLINDDQVDFLIGPYSSGLAHAAAAIAEAHQKVLWNHGGSSDAIMRQGYRWSVHLPTPASGYFAGLFACLLRHGAEAGRVAIVKRHRGTFSAEVASGAKQQAERCGFAMLSPFFYPDDPNHLVSLAEALVAADPTVLIAVGRYDDDVALIRTMAQMSCGVKVIAAVGAPMQAFWTDLQAMADGCIGPSQWEPGAAGSFDVGMSSAVFIERFRQRFGQIPDYPAAQAYAAGLILQRCVALAGTCSDVTLRAAADTLTCRTFYGDFRLEAETGRQVGHEALLVQWQESKKHVVWPAEIAQTAVAYPRRSSFPLPLGEGEKMLPTGREERVIMD
jgi:branched-chain amino acid transport system substrate-binding protein